MSSALFQKTGRKLFASHIDKYSPADPLYEEYVDNRGRTKRRKRDLPPGLSARDIEVLQSVKRRAHYLDRGFNIAGLRFGWTFIIGALFLPILFSGSFHFLWRRANLLWSTRAEYALVNCHFSCSCEPGVSSRVFEPGAGDFADIALNYYLVVKKAREADIPGWLVTRMLLNNSVSAIVGFVPFVGDIVLAQFKANWRNAALLEEYLRIRGETYLEMKAQGKNVVPIGTPRPKGKGKVKGKGEEQKDSGVSDESGNGQVDIGGGKAAWIPKGVSKSDAEQLKPGAGIEDGEVIEEAKDKEPGPSSATTAIPSAKAAGKRRLSFNLNRWRKDSSGKAKQVEADHGKFVEHLVNEDAG